MSEKTQFNTRVEERLVEQVQSFDRSNTDVVSEALEMWLEAHGLESPEGIKREIKSIDSEIQTVRNEANREITELQEKRDKLTSTLETMQEQRSDDHELIRYIAHELASSPNRTIEGFASEITDLLGSPDFTARPDVINALDDYARDNDLQVRRDQLYPETTTTTVAATDGSGETSSIDTSRYECVDDDDDKTIMTDGGMVVDDGPSPTELYDQLEQPIQTFIRDRCEDEFSELLQKYPKEKRSLWIDWTDLHTFDPALAEDFLAEYEKFKSVFQMALRETPNPINADLKNAKVRMTNIPEDRTYKVGTYRKDQRGEFIAVSGQISKMGDVKLRPDILAYECLLCGTITDVPQIGNEVQEPYACSGCERKTAFKKRWDKSEGNDEMLIQLKRPPEENKGGDGGSVDVVLVNELERWLNDRDVSAGARVTINGLLRAKESDDGAGAFGYTLNAESIEIEEQDYAELDIQEHKDEIKEYANREDIYELLSDSLATEIMGGDKMRDIKLTVMLQQFSGYKRQDLRGDGHILLVGDPSTGKSSILDDVENISPRAVRTSGKGASAAGMTAAVVSDDTLAGQSRALEAGALALADGGTACVDEIDKMKDDARQSMHDALEKQVININKWGINASIPSRTSLLAAGNPKYDRFDHHEPIGEQIDLDGALLSRFDLIFVLLDTADEDLDQTVSEGKVDIWQESADVDKGKLEADEADSITRAIPEDVLRAYIAYARRNIKPRMTDEAGARITEYYTGIREGTKEDDPIPVASRKLDAIRRFSEAAARVKLSETVELEHVETALDLIGRSLADVGIDPETGEFDADIVETGQPKSQRDRIRSLKDLVEDVEADYDDGAPEKVVISRANSELNMDSSDTEHEIDKLKQKGELYEPSTGNLRVS